MKTIKNTVLILSFFLLLISCSKNDAQPTAQPQPQATAASIIGKWSYISAVTKDGNTVISTQVFTSLPNCTPNNLTIKSDNTIVDVIYTGICTPNPVTHTYTYSENIFNYNFADKTIVTLTDTKLVWSYPTGPYVTFYTFERI